MSAFVSVKSLACSFLSSRHTRVSRTPIFNFSTRNSQFASGSYPCCSLLVSRRRVVRLQIAERVLNARENVLEHIGHRVNPLVVAVRLIENTTLPLAPD